MRTTSETVKITKTTIEGAWRRRAEGHRLIVRDKECRGLALIVNEASMRWEYSYRPRGNDPTTGRRWPNRTVTIGNPETHSPDDARTEANRLKGQAKAGADPVADRKAAIQARRAAQVEAAARAAQRAFTFGKLVESWAAARAGDRRPSYLREAAACLRRNLPDWQDRPAADITLAEAVRALDALKASKGTVAANRTQAYARAAYSWAIKRQMLTINPMRGIEKPGREMARERVLLPDELGAIWRACDALPLVRASFVRTLMLTMQRREEVAAMRWDELDSPHEPTIWTLPGTRAKNGKTHIIHLSPAARAVLKSLPKVELDSPIFAGHSATGGLGAFGRMKSAIDKRISEDGKRLPEWRFHDFRRSGVTALAGMGFPPHVCDRLLNHITGSIQGVAAIYQRHEFLQERRAALEAWASLILTSAEGKAAVSNVVELRREAVG